VVAQLNIDADDIDISPSNLRKAKRSWNLSEGSSSFKGLSAFGKMGGRGSGRISTEELIDKPNEYDPGI